MNLELAGRSVLVTGASKGIGLAVARTFAGEGCSLHLVARTPQTLDAAKEQIASDFDVRVTVHPLDLSQRGAATALAGACGDVDILVNNAGAIPGGDLEAIDEERWRAAWDLKVFGYINLTREYLTRMKAKGAGTIVNVIGLAGERFDAGYVAGSTGNASLMAFTRTVGSTSLDHGVRVVAVNPGAVETERIETLFRTRARKEHGDESKWREYFKALPMQRAATAQEVADLVVFLASPRASYISGTVVTLDGGFAARAR